MKRPDTTRALEPLKPFQRRTVEHAFERLFLAEDSTARFLVADEVGLGKTLVARGIIAKAIEHLWNDVERIDIVYICSNGSIARANLPKLRIGGSQDREFALATRLTLLAPELSAAKLLDSKLNFVSFTPGTSFELGNAGGQRREREVLFQLLVPEVKREIPLLNLLQGKVGKKNDWRWKAKAQKYEIDERIRMEFLKHYRANSCLAKDLEEALNAWFFRYRECYPPEAKSARNKVIGALRHTLANTCVQALEPDLVILDEFQRFKPLLETRKAHQSEAARLAQSLFNAELPEGGPVRTLLLSATPYKLYTSDAEIEQEDHYKDFLATTRFLFADQPSCVDSLQGDLSHFATCIKRLNTSQESSMKAAHAAKSSVEVTLRKVMSRTERIAASAERDAMLREDQPNLSINRSDIRQYMATNAMFRAVGSETDPMPLWKSAPYLVNFMHGYKFNERLLQAADESPGNLCEVLKSHPTAFLKKSDIDYWSPINYAHAKVRSLVQAHLDNDMWQLLWLPPTLPYWPLETPFLGARYTKSLLFSAWNFVPEAVSALMSYEAERRMADNQWRSYTNPEQQQGALLQLTQSATGERTRHRLLHLLLPCLPLADEAHPLSTEPDTNRQDWVHTRIAHILNRLPNPQHGPVDSRWEWVTPVLLDPRLRDFLTKWRASQHLPKPDAKHFGAHLHDLLNVDASQLGRRPPDLVETLTQVALGSPAILALRTLGMKEGISEGRRRSLAVEIANSFWSLFDRPAVIALLRQLSSNRNATGAQPPYWRLVLDYCRKGKLQAVLDEQWHMLWEQHSWSESSNTDDVASKCAQEIKDSVHPLRSRVHARILEATQANTIEFSEMRLRTVFALRFGHLSSDDDQSNFSQDRVRIAFNSPFRPFVLASTSIGQEGLDFHPWCHRVVHWNLPGNPVDLEQREGRVHRYKGHAVRRNLAAAHGDAALANWHAGDDVWKKIFDLGDDAARQAEKPDMVPYWVAPGEHRIERHVPLLPYSSEHDAFPRLKRQLAAYRVVFGQPRQEELLSLLDRSTLSDQQLQALTIDLSPPDE